LCLAGAAILLLASGRAWARLTVEVAPELPRSAVLLTGRDLAPIAAAAGVAGLAAVAGIAATRGWLRRGVGAVAALLGLGAAVACAAGPSAARAEAVAGRLVGAELTAWPVAGVAGGGLLLAGGVLVAAHGQRWATMGRRYDAPASAGRVGRAGGVGRRADDAGELWDAIDRGEDPTAKPS
jgi:uncharacterized membrane protein (TIGR02234 family)